MNVIPCKAWSHDARACVPRDDLPLAAVCGVRMTCDGRHLPQPARHAGNVRCRTVTGRYRRLSGMTLVLNANFNLHQEPVKCGPQEAARTLVDRRIDQPAIGDFRGPGDTGNQ